MRTVSVIGFDGALASAITGVIDLFRLAGVTWARINDTPPEQQFTTQLLTEGGRPCRCINGITLMADGDWRDIPTGNSQADLVIVPTIGAPIAQVLEANPGMIDWLGGFQEAPTGQVRLASNCTGAFLLAEAFVIDAGRTSQAPYGALQARRYHSDAAVLKLQDWHPVFIGRDLGGNPSAFGPGYA